MITATFANPAAKVELTRTFNAPPAKVFEAWSRPELWSRWFPPRCFTMTIEHMDFRVGGGFSATFHGPDDFKHSFTGTYVELVPGEKLAWKAQFTYGPEDLMLTTVTFKEVEGGKTELHVLQAFRVVTPEIEPSIQGAPIGWGQTLDKLGEHLADPTATLE